MIGYTASIDYIQIISVLTSAVQELYNEVKTIKKNHSDDHNRLNNIDNKLNIVNDFLAKKYPDFT